MGHKFKYTASKTRQNILDEYTPQGEETGKEKISWIEQANIERKTGIIELNMQYKHTCSLDLHRKGSLLVCAGFVS